MNGVFRTLFSGSQGISLDFDPSSCASGWCGERSPLPGQITSIFNNLISVAVFFSRRFFSRYFFQCGRAGATGWTDFLTAPPPVATKSFAIEYANRGIRARAGYHLRHSAKSSLLPCRTVSATLPQSYRHALNNHFGRFILLGLLFLHPVN